MPLWRQPSHAPGSPGAKYVERGLFVYFLVCEGAPNGASQSCTVGRLGDGERFNCINSKSIPHLRRYLRLVPTNVGPSDWQLAPTPSISGDSDETSAPLVLTGGVRFQYHATPRNVTGA